VDDRGANDVNLVAATDRSVAQLDKPGCSRAESRKTDNDQIPQPCTAESGTLPPTFTSPYVTRDALGANDARR
jgi:hypothetical protein